MSILYFTPNSLFKKRETSWTGNVEIRKRKFQFVGEEFKGGIISFVAQQSSKGLDLLITEVSRSQTITHTDTNTQTLVILWTSDQPVTENTTYRTHNKHKRKNKALS